MPAMTIVTNKIYNTSYQHEYINRDLTNSYVDYNSVHEQRTHLRESKRKTL